MKSGKFLNFCLFRCQFETFSIEKGNKLFENDFCFFLIWKTAIIFSEKPTGQQTSAMLIVFNILLHEVYQKFDKNCIKTFLKWKLLQIFSFWGHFWVILGSLGSTKKSPEILTNTNRTKLNLCELNSMGNTLKVEYKFGAWQVL